MSQPLHTAPRSRSAKQPDIFITLHDENGTHVGAWDQGTHEWRNVHGEVLALEGVVMWSPA